MEKLKYDDFLHRMARGHLPLSYWDNRANHKQTTVSNGQMMACALQGMAHEVIDWVWKKIVPAILVSAVITCVLAFGLWIYCAFMPTMHAMWVSALEFTSMAKLAASWLGSTATILLGTSVLLVAIQIITNELSGLFGFNNDPLHLIPSWTENIIFFLARCLIWLINLTGLMKLFDGLTKKLEEPVEIE